VTEPVPVRLERDSPAARWALDVLLRLAGVRWRHAEPGEEAMLTYGAAGEIPTGPAEGWDEPSPLVARSEELPIVHLPGGPKTRRSGHGLGFDAIYAAYALLTAPWERVDPANEVGTPIAAEGWLARNGLLDEPLVHRYAEELRGLLHVAPRAPASGILVLTHDVDEQFRGRFGVREAKTRLGRDLRARRPSSLRRMAGLVRRLGARGRDPNDRWDEWRALVDGWGGRATFFVASYNLFDAAAERYDVAYDVRDPVVAETFRDLAGRGAEIGVHLSLQARRGSEQIRRERERLEQSLGRPVRSARHHWWALGRDSLRTLRAHAEAGLVVDCSFGFNDRPGFRRGIAAPFRPFDPEAGAPIDLWALPTVAMDRALFDGEADAQQAGASLRSLYETTRDVGGALVLDWHSHVLNPAAMHGAGRGLLDFAAWALADGAELRTPLQLVDDLAGSG
jgi:hypothetical protein